MMEIKEVYWRRRRRKQQRRLLCQKEGTTTTTKKWYHDKVNLCTGEEKSEKFLLSIPSLKRNLPALTTMTTTTTMMEGAHGDGEKKVPQTRRKGTKDKEKGQSWYLVMSLNFRWWQNSNRNNNNNINNSSINGDVSNLFIHKGM